MRSSHLVANSAVRSVVSGIDFADVNNHAEEIVRAGPLKLVVVLGVARTGAVGIREHVQLQGELHGCVDLGGGFVVAALFELESLVARWLVNRTHRQNTCKSAPPESLTRLGSL